MEVHSYEYVVSSNAQVFALSDIDFEGKETLHGPFMLGQTYGMVAERQAIDWAAERIEREAKEAKREQQKLEQQRLRSLHLKERKQYQVETLQEDAA